MSPTLRPLGRAVIVLGLTFIAALTLIPTPELAGLNSRTPVFCLVCGSHGGIDVLLNILLFIPLGIGLRLAGLPVWRATLAAGLTSLMVETLQLSIVTGRDASLSDLVTNTTGGFVGALVATHWRGVLRPGPALGRWLTAAGCLAGLGILAGTAWIIQPSLPASTYYGQWAADLEHLSPFPGTVRGAWIDGIAIPGHRLERSGRVRRALLDGDTELSALADPAEPTDGLAPIVSIFDREQREIVLLGQNGRAAEFRLRTRATLLRLRPPAIRLDDAFSESGEAGTSTRRIAGGLREGRLGVGIGGENAPVRSFALPLSVGWGWSLVLPFDYAFGPETRFLTALWLGGLFLPLGYWARARRSGTEDLAGVLAVGMTLALGLGVLPLAADLPPAHWSEWLAAAAGFALGRAARGRIVRA